MWRKVGGCGLWKRLRYASPSRASLRRLISGGSSRNNGISQWPSSSNGGGSLTGEETNPPLEQLETNPSLEQVGTVSLQVEKMKCVLEQLGKRIGDMSKPDNKSTGSSRLRCLRNFFESNIPELGQVLEKFGSGGNAQISQVKGRDGYGEVSNLLKGLGHLHWVAVLLFISGTILDHWSKAKKYPEKLLSHMTNLADFGQTVTRFHCQMQNCEDPESLATIQKAVRLICDHALYCNHDHATRNMFKRMFFAKTDVEMLDELQKELYQLYPEITFTAVSSFVQPYPPVNPFEVIEETVMVGNEERVKEAFDRLKNCSLQRVRALVVYGLPGCGKSIVGLHVAQRLMENSNRRYHNQRCKIAMRSPEGNIKVEDKQKEMYQTLSGRRVTQGFEDPAEGRQLLQDLFKRQKSGPTVIFLDNVHKIGDVQELLPTNLNECLHPESVLLVTTANQDVISNLKDKGVICVPYKVKELDENQAKDLMLKRIFGGTHVPNSTLEVLLVENEHFCKLLKCCGGVPLAINVVGSYISSRGQSNLRGDREELLPGDSFEEDYVQLQDKERNKFVDKLIAAVTHALKSLSEGDPMTNEKDCLQISLQFACDQLNYNTRIREKFLDIVAVHLGREWEFVEKVCGAEDLGTLKQLSMVERMVYKDGTSIVQVHDLLIGMSRRIETEKSKDRRVVVENAVLAKDFLAERCSGRFDRVELIKLGHCTGDLSATELDCVARGLRYLELNGTKITGNCTIVPQKCQYFKSSSLPFSLHKLQNLEVLDLDFETDPTANLESIQSMRNLQWLRVENSTSFARLDGGLDKLTTVKIENCSNFTRIRGLNAATVQQLAIVNCPKFDDFYSVSTLKCLGRLDFGGFEFTEFPWTFVVPPSVEIMELSRNRNLKVLPRFDPLNNMMKLKVQSCSNLREIRGEMIPSATLDILDLGRRANPERCVAWPDLLPKLKVLELEECPKLSLPELLKSAKIMEGRNPEFRLVGLPIENNDDGGCSFLQRWLRSSLTILKKVPERSLNQCFTFPPRKKDKFL